MGTCASHGIISGVVVDIDSTVEAIRTAVSLASQQSGKEITSVYAGVTGKHISSVNSRGVIAITHPSREITEEDVDRVTDASRLIVIPPDQMILSAIPRSFSIDGQSGIKHPLGMSGSRLEVETHIITASRTFIDNIGKCIQKAGLYIDEMILQPLATAESVLLPGEKNLGVCILDIGGGTSDMAIFVQGEIYYSAVIPIAGQHVTYDMAYGLQVNEDEAEKIKLKYGCITPQFILDDETVPVLQIGKGAPRQLPRKTL
jgi:cell division protein FtsA